MSLLEQVDAWIADDVDPVDADELRALADQATANGYDEQTAAAAEAELQDRFAGVLQFGTAGLRGRLGAGPNRMNRAVVIRAAAGLMSYLNERLDDGATVVIGYDARHRSDAFAADTAHVVAAAGGRALLLPGPLPTPVLAFAVRHVGADAGVMVTASHNPPQDNGYKVYLGGRVTPDEGAGVQIVPPADADIAAHIAAVPSVSAVPRSTSAIEASGGQVTEFGDEIRSAYTERALASVPQGPRDLRIVLTPLHGVGGDLASEVLTRAGFDDVTLVAEQAEPDPEFSTVAFPNPEEPGAMDLAVATAVRVEADLIIANDPDADRCSIAVPDAAVEGGWRQLTGDEAGALLGEQAAIEAASGRGRTTGAGSGQEPDPPSGQEPDPPAGQVPGRVPVLASSVVSSRVLAAIADAHGLTHRATLTGFKWIARVPGLVFGYEEAIGYCVDPQGVRDKDGITAALHLAALAARLRHDGGSIPGALDDLARRYGLHATAPLSVRVDDLPLIGAAMARLREHPPATLAGSAVAQAFDLAQGSAGLPATDALLYLTVDADRVIVRPSGTEPKVKCYLEVILPVGDGEDVCEVRARATARLAELSADIGTAAGLI